ncbi:MAG: 3'(2'),5'-bisphosphate nucleotidase [Candidatus Eiseniibacteriota bacterium]|jgi:3'(2'), 5'-bisphosphate nucleotidase
MELERNVALGAVRDAATACVAVRRHLVSASTLEKRDRSPVTVADYASQAIICRTLGARFPADAVVAEESSEALRSSAQRAILDRVTAQVGAVVPGATASEVLGWIDHGNGIPARRFWTLDPIDGTKGFLRGGQYAIALALIEDGEVVLGALACPELPVDPRRPDGARGVVQLGLRGEGAWQAPLAGDGDLADQWVPIATDPADDPATSRLVESVESGHANHDAQARIAAQLGVRRAALRIDSQAKYAAVARGEASVYLRLPSPATPDYRECIWDHAAGMCIVQSAGGRVSDATGRALDVTRGRRLLANQGVIATSGPIHDAVLRACFEVAAVS